MTDNKYKNSLANKLTKNHKQTDGALPNQQPDLNVPPTPSNNTPNMLTEKKKVGRPKTKTEPCKTINISIPISRLDEMNIAKAAYKDNLTLYINTLIQKDLDANLDDYKSFVEMQKKFN